MRALFVSHEASATGAPIFFLEWLRWFHQHKKESIDTRILIIKDGTVHDQFASLAPTLNMARENLSLHSERCEEFLLGSFDFVHLNTIESSHVLAHLVERGHVQPSTYVVSHVHELEGTIQMYGPRRIQPVAERANKIICVSEPVRDNLVRSHGFPFERTVVIPPCSRSFADEATVSSVQKAQMRKRVLACGEISVGKGVDVFIRTAQELKRLAPGQFEFCWLGEDTRHIRAYFETDLERLGLKEDVKFLGFSPNPAAYFKGCDVFYMCSRQDSFPLVCLEAVSLRKPVVYFPDAGGIKELLGSDAGFPVAYIDERGAAQTILDVVADPQQSTARTQVAFDRWYSQYRSEALLDRVAQTLPPGMI